ncbi:PAS domain-containing protein [Sphingomonas sp. MMS24-JH45]
MAALKARLAATEERLRESDTRHRLLTESWAQAVWETIGTGGWWLPTVPAGAPTPVRRWRSGWALAGWMPSIPAIGPMPSDNGARERPARGFIDAEFRLCAPDGGWRWTNVRAAPVLDAAGNVRKWVGLNIDIDDRKRAEAALRESEERLRLALEVGRVAAWDWDIETGEVRWSDEHFRMQGYAVGEVAPELRGLGDDVHPDDLAGTEAAMTGPRARRGLCPRIPLAAPGRHGALAIRLRAFLLRRPWCTQEDGRRDDRRHRTPRRGRATEDAAGRTPASRSQHPRDRPVGREPLRRCRRPGRGLCPASPGAGSALARTHVLPTRHAGGGVDMEDMIRDDGLPRSRSIANSTLDLPLCRAVAEGREVLTLAVHELQEMNATKYGAFSRPSGRLSVDRRRQT